MASIEGVSSIDPQATKKLIKLFKATPRAQEIYKELHRQKIEGKKPKRVDFSLRDASCAQLKQEYKVEKNIEKEKAHLTMLLNMPLPRIVLNDKQRELLNWSITIADSNKIIIEGQESGDPENIYWRTSVICHRISTNTVKSVKGTFYFLLGAINEEDMIQKGFSEEIINVFRYGFPPTWQDIFSNTPPEEQQREHTAHSGMKARVMSENDTAKNDTADNNTAENDTVERRSDEEMNTVQNSMEDESSEHFQKPSTNRGKTKIARTNASVNTSDRTNRKLSEQMNAVYSMDDETTVQFEEPLRPKSETVKEKASDRRKRISDEEIDVLHSMGDETTVQFEEPLCPKVKEKPSVTANDRRNRLLDEEINTVHSMNSEMTDQFNEPLNKNPKTKTVRKKSVKTNDRRNRMLDEEMNTVHSMNSETTDQFNEPLNKNPKTKTVRKKSVKTNDRRNRMLDEEMNTVHSMNSETTDQFNEPLNKNPKTKTVKKKSVKANDRRNKILDEEMNTVHSMDSETTDQFNEPLSNKNPKTKTVKKKSVKANDRRNRILDEEMSADETTDQFEEQSTNDIKAKKVKKDRGKKGKTSPVPRRKGKNPKKAQYSLEPNDAKEIEVQRSRSGRIICPALDYWIGQRMCTSPTGEGEVTIIKSNLEEDSRLTLVESSRNISGSLQNATMSSSSNTSDPTWRKSTDSSKTGSSRSIPSKPSKNLPKVESDSEHETSNTEQEMAARGSKKRTSEKFTKIGKPSKLRNIKESEFDMSESETSTVEREKWTKTVKTGRLKNGVNSDERSESETTSVDQAQTRVYPVRTRTPVNFFQNTAVEPMNSNRTTRQRSLITKQSAAKSQTQSERNLKDETSRKTSKTGSSSSKTGTLIAKKGSLARKRELRDMLEQQDEGYEDDAFEGTPFKSQKLVTKHAISPVEIDELADLPEEFNNEDYKTPSSRTPMNRLRPAGPLSTAKSEADIMTPGLLYAVKRNNVDRYVNQLKKQRLRNVRNKVEAQTPLSKKPISIIHSLPGGMDYSFNVRKSTASEDEDNEGDDYYWSDNE